MNKYKVSVNLSEVVDGSLMKEFLKAYEGWIQICRPSRLDNGSCSGCPLDGSHHTEICGAFQEIGRKMEKNLTQKIREIERKPVPTADDYKVFLQRYACPGPDLYQPKSSELS